MVWRNCNLLFRMDGVDFLEEEVQFSMRIVYKLLTSITNLLFIVLTETYL
jgi:hypothetical protein